MKISGYLRTKAMQNHLQSSGKKTMPLQEQSSYETSELSKQTLNDLKDLYQSVRKIFLYISPRYYWMVYTCYFLIFIHTYIGQITYGADSIKINNFLYESIFHSSYTDTPQIIILAIMCAFIFLAILKSIKYFIYKSYILSICYILHVMIFLSSIPKMIRAFCDFLFILAK